MIGVLGRLTNLRQPITSSDPWVAQEDPDENAGWLVGTPGYGGLAWSMNADHARCIAAEHNAMGPILDVLVEIRASVQSAIDSPDRDYHYITLLAGIAGRIDHLDASRADTTATWL